jgi:hypothetical protein
MKETHCEPILNWMSLIKLQEIIHQPKWRLIESLGAKLGTHFGKVAKLAIKSSQEGGFAKFYGRLCLLLWTASKTKKAQRKKVEILRFFSTKWGW